MKLAGRSGMNKAKVALARGYELVALGVGVASYRQRLRWRVDAHFPKDTTPLLGYSKTSLRTGFSSDQMTRKFQLWQVIWDDRFIISNANVRVVSSFGVPRDNRRYLLRSSGVVLPRLSPWPERVMLFLSAMPPSTPWTWRRARRTCPYSCSNRSRTPQPMRIFGFIERN